VSFIADNTAGGILPQLKTTANESKVHSSQKSLRRSVDLGLESLKTLSKLSLGPEYRVQA